MQFKKDDFASLFKLMKLTNTNILKVIFNYFVQTQPKNFDDDDEKNIKITDKKSMFVRIQSSRRTNAHKTSNTKEKLEEKEGEDGC